MRPQRFPQIFPKVVGESKRAYGIIRRKPFRDKVPKAGVEPALPLREPGPEPGASAYSATSARNTTSPLDFMKNPTSSSTRFLDTFGAGQLADRLQAHVQTLAATPRPPGS